MAHRINYFVYISKKERHASWISRHIGSYGNPNKNCYMQIANMTDTFEIVQHSLSKDNAHKLAQKIRRGIVVV